jgi:ABC-type sulfate/molybdate transport systems ATPase subunit
VIIVTHQFEEAELLADDFIWLENGKIKHQGSKADFLLIKTDYLSAR